MGIPFSTYLSILISNDNKKEKKWSTFVKNVAKS
jgi:hypothetical protein